MTEDEELELLQLEKEKSLSGRQQMSQVKEPTFGEKVGALTYGGVVGLGGGLGELEKFGAYTVPEFLGLREKDQRDQLMGRETIFPTGTEVERGLAKVGIQPPREEVSGYKTAGEIIGGFGTALPSILKTGTKMVLGVPSVTREATAKTAERLGFKLSPSQVRRVEPVAEKGATGFALENQSLANKLASKATGQQVAEITPEFVRGRLKSLGSEFDKVYKGKIFNVDTEAIQALDAIRTFETNLPPSQQLAAVRNTADAIVKNFSSLAGREGAKPKTFAISGDALQTIRNDLMAAARSASDRSDAHRLYELVDAIDGSIARNYPEIAGQLNKLRPLYRNSVILEDLIRQKGVRGGDISLEALGNMLGSQKQAIRRIGGELDELGRIGQELQLRPVWQRSGTDGSLRDILGTTMGKMATSAGLKTRQARAIQRTLKEKPMTVTERATQATAVGTAAKPLQSEQ